MYFLIRVLILTRHLLHRWYILLLVYYYYYYCYYYYYYYYYYLQGKQWF